MKRLLIGVLLVSAQALCANAQPTILTPDEKSSSQSKQVDALMASWFKSDAPGAAVMVIKDGRTLHRKATVWPTARLKRLSVWIRPR
jgi:hypothetical protein